MARARFASWLLVAALGFGAAGCFSPSEPVCSFACAEADPKCPQDYVCAGDGYCHLSGHENESCGFSDASVPSDMAAKAGSVDLAGRD